MAGRTFTLLAQSKIWRTIAAILGTVLAGAIGSGVWDVIAKPGITRAGRFLLTVLTLGSKTVRDTPYSSAALNPYSLPALQCLTFAIVGFSTLMLLPVLIFSRRPGTDKYAGELRHELDRIPSADERIELLQSKLTSLLRKRRYLIAFQVVLTAVVVGVMYVEASVVNQAVLIRRIHDANMQIIEPYISAQELSRLRGQFAAVTSQADYAAVRFQIEQVATAHGIRLREEVVK